MTLIFFLVALFTAAAGLTFGQSIDLSGTWVGETEVPDEVEPDVMTLVLKKEAGDYTGTITDSMGMLNEAACEDIKFVDNKLTFNVEVDTGSEYLQVYLSFTVEGDTMTGFWEAEDGSMAEVTIKRK